MSAQLPDYVASARPVSAAVRVPWYKSSAPTYAGVMLWVVFWQDIAAGKANDAGIAKTLGGTLAAGLMVPILAVIAAALICHLACYLAPGLMGQKTGLSLAVVGTSTYGTTGGFFMPGFFMGVLQFGWLGVNSYFSSMLLAMTAGYPVNGSIHFGIGIAWACLAAFLGLKGIQYVAKVSTYLPLIPVAILLLLFVKTMGGLGGFEPSKTGVIGEPAATAVHVAETPKTASGTSDSAATIPAAVYARMEETDSGETLLEQLENAVVTTEEAVKDAVLPVIDSVEKTAIEEQKLMGEVPADEQLPAVGSAAIFLGLLAYIVGFFATAGAAGVGISSSCATTKDAHRAGMGGIVAVTCFSAILAILIVAGAYGTPDIAAKLTAAGNPMRVPNLMDAILGSGMAKICMFGLAIAAFPSACFCSLVAADSFKNTLPKVNPFISCGIGTLCAIALVVSKYAGAANDVFELIGASFGPICGAMTADYLLAGCKWPGPRAGFNPAGWLSWAIGFVVGIWNKIPSCANIFEMPCPPVAAIITGFVLYVLFAKAGMLSRSIEFNPEKG